MLRSMLDVDEFGRTLPQSTQANSAFVAFPAQRSPCASTHQDHSMELPANFFPDPKLFIVRFSAFYMSAFLWMLWLLLAHLRRFS